MYALPRQNKQGSTLIEALVTILFIAVAIIALIRFQRYLAYDNSIAQQKIEATAIGMSRLETLGDYQVFNTTAGYYAYQDITTSSATVTGLNASYNVAWTVTAFTNPTYKQINLTVTWTDRNNVSQSIRLVTYVAGIEPSRSANIM
jgi:Tfp pilus assembly protein PilV